MLADFIIIKKPEFGIDHMTLKTGLHVLKAIFLFFLFFFNQTVQALPAMAMGYDVKYPADFKHFDYVNPDA